MFQLSRYFSIAAFVGIAVVVGVLWALYRHVAISALIEHETRSNVALTRAFANSIWADYGDFVHNASKLSVEELVRQPEISRMRAELRRQMRGLNVVKVKIYNLDGLILFSTDPSQVGQQNGTNGGFLRARAGETASEITFRNQFYAFEQTIVDRNLLASYIPVRKHDAAPVEAVFELYSDVTDLVESMQRTERKVVGGVFGSLFLLYLFLFLIVRRADRLLKRHEAERQAHAAQMTRQAYYDALTGLPNRTYFNERLNSAITRAKRASTTFALMFLDLDRFKIVNDSLGHDMGDELLRVVAQRLQSCVREADSVFRMGGDEFTIIVEASTFAEERVAIARRIIDATSQPITLQGQDVVVTTSIGIAVYPRDDDTSEQLTKNADAAMYRAKESGGNAFEFYRQDMNARAHERLLLETGLQRAIKNREFVLYYQPKVSNPGGEILGIEALLRWNHPEMGLIKPDKFVQSLEDSGLIIPVGEWVLWEACRQNKAWQKAGLTPLRVSVNISSRQFKSASLLGTVRRVLRETGLAPGDLELELTESLLVENTEAAIEIMNALKRIGVVLSIDDFGAGYSSLNYLKRFPIDCLKIDKSFIRDLATNAKDVAIIKAIATLAHSLNVALIAEGVENLDQLELLRANGCDEVQGYLFSEPVPPEEIRDMLRTGTFRTRSIVAVKGARPG